MEVLREQNNGIQYIRKEIEAEAKQRQEVNINRMPAVKIVFQEGDERLRVNTDGTGFSGTLAIVLANVNDDEMKIGRSGSRRVHVAFRLGCLSNRSMVSVNIMGRSTRICETTPPSRSPFGPNLFLRQSNTSSHSVRFGKHYGISPFCGNSR
jgi:hypothetical protein